MTLKSYLNNMVKSQLQLAWKNITDETHKRSKLGKRLKEKEISQFGDLLLFTQVLLEKIEAGKDVAFNTLIFKKTMNFYRAQMK